MASGQNLASSAVILMGLMAVVMFMKKNRVNTESYSLVQACRIAEGRQQVTRHECDTLEQHMYEWDTSIPCFPGFKTDTYFWTPRMFFDLTEKNSNMSWGEAIDVAGDMGCAGMNEDPDFDSFMARRREGRSEKRDLIVAESALAYVAAHKVAFIAGTLIAIIFSVIVTGWQNYKACSTGLAWETIWTVDDLPDRAQCSKPTDMMPNKCKRHHSSGASGWWYYFSMGTRNWLNRGCVIHDNCLRSFPVWSYGRDGCDAPLTTRATVCKGRRWWHSQSCYDGYLFSKGISVAMGSNPNRSTCLHGTINGVYYPYGVCLSPYSGNGEGSGGPCGRRVLADGSRQLCDS